MQFQSSQVSWSWRPELGAWSLLGRGKASMQFQSWQVSWSRRPELGAWSLHGRSRCRCPQARRVEPSRRVAAQAECPWLRRGAGRVQPIRFPQRRVEPDWQGVRPPKPTRSVGGNPRGEAAGFKLSAELVRTCCSRGSVASQGRSGCRSGPGARGTKVRSLASCAAVE